MYFDRLPKDLHPYIKELTKDVEFNKILNEDKILDELEDREIDKEFEHICAGVMLGKNLSMLDHTFKPLTAIAVCKMWCNNNPIITGNGKLEMKHFDEFFKLLEYPESEEDFDGYTLANYGDCLEHLDKIVEFELKLAFFPLNMFPSSEIKSNSQTCFDSDWLMKCAAIACRIGNFSLDDALRLPLHVISSLFIQNARIEGVKNIERQAPEEILRQQAYRVSELVIDRLIELGRINKSDRDYYIELVTKEEEKA